MAAPRGIYEIPFQDTVVFGRRRSDSSGYIHLDRNETPGSARSFNADDRDRDAGPSGSRRLLAG